MGHGIFKEMYLEKSKESHNDLTIEFPGSRFVYLFWSCTIWDNARFFAAKCQRTSKNTNWSTSNQGIIVALDINNQADLLQRVGL